MEVDINAPETLFVCTKNSNKLELSEKDGCWYSILILLLITILTLIICYVASRK